MEENIYNNYTNENFDYDDINKYLASEQYFNEGDKIIMPLNNTRYFHNKNRKSHISNSNIYENQDKFISKNAKKQFLYNSYNNNINTNTNYIINNHKYNYNIRQPLSKSIKPNDDFNNIIMNDKKLNSNIKYIKMNNNNNILNKKRDFYSSINSLNKNINNQIKKVEKNDLNQNIDANLENSAEIDNYNKNQFFQKIKEIKDLEYYDQETEDLQNNLVLKNNNIFINENKNIYLNNINPKNNNFIKNTSEKKELNSYNRINLQNRNINNIIKQKNINTEKKANIRNSKKISEKIINSNNLSDNKNNNIDKKNFLNIGVNKGTNSQNLYKNNKFNDLSIQNNFNTYTKLEENNNIIQLRNSNYTKYEKKFSDKLNISPTQKRFSTLTGEKEEEMNLKPSSNGGDIEKLLINQKNINDNLRKKIEYMNLEIQRKNNIIKKLYFQNEKYKSIIQKMKKDNESKQKVNNELTNKINNYKNEIILLKNKVKYNFDNNSILKSNYIREINNSKEKIRKYEHENNNLKMLLIKNKERQYSTDISKNNIYNSFINYDEQSREMSNYRDFNKSVSVSRTKNKLNIPIFKRYQEDFLINENKSSNNNLISNIKIINK